MWLMRLGVLCVLGCPRREVVDEGTAPLAFDLPEVARMDHQQRLIPYSGGWFGLIRQLVLHAAVDMQWS